MAPVEAATIVLIVYGVFLAACAVVVVFHFQVPPSWAYLRDRTPDPEAWSRLYSGEDLLVVLSALAAVRSAFGLRRDDIHRKGTR